MERAQEITVAHQFKFTHILASFHCLQYVLTITYLLPVNAGKRNYCKNLRGGTNIVYKH